MGEPVSPKTPAEVLDYEIEWAAQLSGDSISTSTWAVPADQPGSVTLSGDTTAGTKAAVFVSGGVAGTPVQLTNTITTGAGRTLARTLLIPVVAVKLAGSSHAETVLAAIEAVIERRATVDQESYQIEGRSLNRTPISDLLTLRARYRAEVEREQAAAARAVGETGSASRVRAKFNW